MLLKNSPQSRTDDIVVQELKDEILIYDLKTNKAFCLNETSALVWQACDGNKSVSEISKQLSRKLNSKVDEDFVWLAVDQLKKDNLLANSEDVVPDFNGMSRREVIRKVGFASMVALPVVASLVAPTAAMAQSQAQQLQPSGCPTGPNTCTGTGLTSIPCGAATNDKFEGTCAECLACLPPCCAGQTIAASACSLTNPEGTCSTCTRTCA